MTGLTLVTASLRLCGQIKHAGQGGSSSETSEAFLRLNEMLQSWSQEQFAIAQLTREAIALTGAASYAIPLRPISVLSAETISAAGVQMPAKVVTAEEWPRFADATETGSFVECVLVDYGFTAATARVYPLPPSGSLILFSLKPLTAIALIGDTVSLPPGYEQALVYNLAIQLAPLHGREVGKEVALIAASSRDAIAKTNAQLRAQSPTETK